MPMEELLGHVETIPAREASVTRVYQGEGQRVRGRQGADPRYMLRLAETVELIAGVRSGAISEWRLHQHLEEAMSTSDFGMFADILDRQLLANYAEVPVTWPDIAFRKVVRDFRDAKLYAIDGGEGLLTTVDELAPYPAGAVDDTPYTLKVRKHGRRLPISWEAVLNDDLGFIAEFPDRLARAARRTEDYEVTTLYVDANGPHASLYTVGNENIINATNAGNDFTANNPPLSIDAVRQGLAVLANQRDSDGMPIMIQGVTLRVPPALETKALEIVNATEIIVGADSEARRLMTPNWARNRIKVSVDWFIPYVASNANGNRMWALFADPRTSRPALALGLLRGHEVPEIFMKLPNQVRVRGGSGEIVEDFDIDAVDHKVRHVIGSTRVDPKMTAASNGSGS